MPDAPPPEAPKEEDLTWDKAFEPYAMELGFFLREWNDLQEEFADLFTTLVGVQDGGVSRTIWYSVQSDRQQRKLLRSQREASSLRPTS